MAEHRAQISIHGPPDAVFALLANPMNLPRWLPMLRESFREEPDRIRVIGGGLGARGVAAHVRFVADAGQRRVGWATATGVGCAGDVFVRDGAAGSAVEMVLRLGNRAEQPQALAHWTGDPALDLGAALQATLVAAKRLCEDKTHAAPLVSGGTQDDPGQAPLADSRAYGSSATQNPPG